MRAGGVRAGRVTLLLSGMLAAAALAGCGGRQSTLAPHSPQTHLIALLWWWMLGAATVVFAGAVALLAIAWVRRRKPGLPFFGEREDLSGGLVVLFGIVIPIVVLVALFGAANLYVIRTTSAPAASSTALTVEVTGHQWWWEVSYPASGAVTANEIHIPVNTRVNAITRTADVIHSFWVPRLARKIDMTPGRTTSVLLYASQAGVYRGQCAEFCGVQHANMGLEVVAEPQPAFKRWLANMARPALTPRGGAERSGERLFMNDQCASCHQIRGTPAKATVGPDLTHLATRSTLASATIPNDPAELAAWISSPQAIKPGTRMPDLGLSR
ncbi:MAG: cytochrome c oxidase subunit II, partial [Solirubrobacteraceae bacterium]